MKRTECFRGSVPRISRKITISLLGCLGPRCSRRRTCGRTGQQRNDSRRLTLPRVWRYRHQTARRAPYPPTPKSLRDTRRDRPPPFTRSFAKFDSWKTIGDPYTYWRKHHDPSHSARGRRLAAASGDAASPPDQNPIASDARRKWPTYMPDIAYALKGVPQPKRQHGRTWAEVARDEFLSHTTLGVPPWASEAGGKNTGRRSSPARNSAPASRRRPSPWPSI